MLKNIFREKWITESQIFSFHCPYCNIGLICDLQKKLEDNFNDSDLHFGSEILINPITDETRPWGLFEEDFININYIFSFIFKCNNPKCGKKVLLSGVKTYTYTHTEDISYDSETGEYNEDFVFEPIYKIQYFSKPPNIFIPQNNIPINIKNSLLESFSLFWIDEKSCLNKIRVTVEKLLGEQNVFKQNENDSLHSIIEKYKRDSPEVGEMLLAIKWAGNDGSHNNSKTVERSDLIDIYEILETVFNLLYCIDKVKIKSLISKINFQKGL